MDWRLWMSEHQVQVRVMPKITEQRSLHLMMDSLYGFQVAWFREGRILEETWESIKCFLKCTVVDFEVVICWRPIRVRIDITIVFVEEFFILLRRRILFRCFCYHVLKVICDASCLNWIQKATDLDLQRCCTFHGIWIEYQKTLHLIGKHNILELPLLHFRFVNFIWSPILFRFLHRLWLSDGLLDVSRWPALSIFVRQIILRSLLDSWAYSWPCLWFGLWRRLGRVWDVGIWEESLALCGSLNLIFVDVFNIFRDLGWSHPIFI